MNDRPAITPAPTLPKRQLWDLPSTTVHTTSYSCESLTLPVGATLVLSPNSTLTLPSYAVFYPPCTSGFTEFQLLNGSNAEIYNHREPFYASVTILIFVVAVTFVIGWVLLVTILSSATLLSAAGRSSRNSLFPSHGFFGRLMSGASVFTTGTRPALQKIAALIVAVSLTVATADMFRVAQAQYSSGVIRTIDFKNRVAGSLEIRILRVFSDFFMWLAQVQTLIRLFPRHKEKIVIKWIGFLLIILDIVFSCLNSFYINTGVENPRRYKDAIPALSYLFQLSLSLLYATWVFYFVLTKSSYAFFHPNMPSISLIALISTVSLLIPVVFFIADIVIPEVAAWGDYFRWVGALASSVVVWDWVERIDLLEKEGKKDGILGREIFEGDDGFDGARSFTSSHNRGRGRRGSQATESEHADSLFGFRKAAGLVRRHLAHRRAPHRTQLDSEKQRPPLSDGQLHRRPSDPAFAISRPTVDIGTALPIPALQPPDPVDRNNTTSVGSTVYAVRYDSHPEIAAGPDFQSADPASTADSSDSLHVEKEKAASGVVSTNTASRPSVRRRGPISRQVGRPFRTLAALPFRRTRRSPPIEIKNAISSSDHLAGGENAQGRPQQGAKAPFARFSAQGFLSSHRSDPRPRPNPNASLEPTVIPAPARGHTWSPDMLRNLGSTPEGTGSDALEANASGLHPVTDIRTSEHVVASEDLSTRARLRVDPPSESDTLKAAPEVAQSDREATPAGHLQQLSAPRGSRSVTPAVNQTSQGATSTSSRHDGAEL